MTELSPEGVSDALLSHGAKALSKVGDDLTDKATGGAATLIVGAARRLARMTVSLLDRRLGVVESVRHNAFASDPDASKSSRAAFRTFAIAVGPAFRKLEDAGIDTGPIREHFGIRWYSAVSCAVDARAIERFLSVETAGKAAFKLALDDLAGSVELTGQDFPPPDALRAAALRGYKREMARAIFETCRRLRSVGNHAAAKSVLSAFAGADPDVAGELVSRCVHLTETETDAMRAALLREADAGGPRRAAAVILRGLQGFRDAVSDLRAVSGGVAGRADPAGVIGKLRTRFLEPVAAYVASLDHAERRSLWRETGPRAAALDQAFADALQDRLRQPRKSAAPPASPRHPYAGLPILDRAKAEAHRDQGRVAAAFAEAIRDRDIFSLEAVASRLQELDQSLDLLRWASGGRTAADRAVRAARDEATLAGAQAIETLREDGHELEARRLLAAIESVPVRGERWRAEIDMGAETLRAVDITTRWIAAERLDLPGPPDAPPFAVPAPGAS